MEFKNIKKAYKKDQEARLKKNLDMIRHDWSGFVNTWAYREMLTQRQKTKTIPEQKRILVEKYRNETAKRIAAFNTEADQIAAAEDLKELYINVDWVRSATWGKNPHAEVWGCGYYTGTATGCGYDKLSSAIAEALNENKSALKIIYKLYEKELRKNKTASPHSVAYGMGYTYPYYEGGVGYSCFQSIFKKAGAKINEHRATNNADIMIIKF